MARNGIFLWRIPLRLFGLISRRPRRRVAVNTNVEQAFPVRHSLGDGGCLFNFRAAAARMLSSATAIFRGGYLRCDLSTSSAAQAECLRYLGFPVLFVALMAPAFTAYSRTGDILRGGYSSQTATGTAGNGSGSTATVAKLRALEADQLSRTTQAIQAVQAMQVAAQSIAASGPNNLGMNPNNPGHQLPNVPNGLRQNGLQPAQGATANSPLWQNANLPTTSTTNSQTTVTIQQTASKAILNWQTFNVGKNTTAYFNQSAGTQSNGTNNWIALNRVTDPSGTPSQILGSIKAEGQVYIINQNGIIFGGSSQVNVNTLYASTLNIPDASFNEGYLAYEANIYSLGGTFSTTMGNASPSASTTNPAFSRFYQSSDTGGPSLTATTAPKAGDVTVQAGASITTTASGRVVLLGTHVNNAGTISTPGGQTILAAGDSAYLYAEPTPQMQGLSVDVLIDPNTNNTKVNPMADPTAGTTVNSGIITVGEGNATMDGATLVQKGVINALTGVNTNGSIILTARYAPDTSVAGNNNNYISPTIFGSVTFGPYSVTQVLPNLSDPTTTLDAQGFNPSVIVVQGENVLFEGSSFVTTPLNGPDGQAIAPGALLMAPGGTVSVTAPIGYGQLPQGSVYANAYNLGQRFVPIYGSPATAGNSTGTSSSAESQASILVDNGVTIDVSGTEDVSIPVSRNVVAVNLRANELADSPLQRNGPLYGQTVYVDIAETGQNPDGSTWYGTPFANASGYIANIGRSVAERTAVGGEINLISGGSVVAVNGSTLNVSGGWIDYQGGVVATTRLLGTNGQLYDISQADPSITYVGIAGTITITHPKWGVTYVFNTPIIGPTDQRYEQSYLDGRSAGSVAVTAPQMVLDGTLLGESVSGPRQQTINANVDSSIPLGGSLTLQAPPDTTPIVGSFAEPIEEGLMFVVNHASLTPAETIALASGTASLSDPSIDRTETLLLPVDTFSAGGFTTFSTEASSNIGGATVKSVTPFTGNVNLSEGVTLEFGTAASATLNFNFDGTVARNADGTLSTVSTNSNNAANVTVDTYGNVDLEGSITAPAGKIVFNAGVLYGLKFQYDASYLSNPPSITVGSITGSNPTFNLRGLWTNETKLTSDNNLQPLWINGGSFSLSAPGSITISSGSTFDVTGGGEIPSTGKLTSSGEGKGGSLSFVADTDPYLTGKLGFLAKSNLQPVQFDGTFLAYGLGGDGTLALGAGAISFSNDPGTAITSAMIQTSAGRIPGIIVPAGLFSGGEFSSYTFASDSDLTVPKGTRLILTQKVLAPTNIQKLLAAPTGSNVYTFAKPFLLPQFERPPASITLTADSTISVEDGASIETDPKGSIALKGTPLSIPTPGGPPIVTATFISVYGTLDAPAGSITLDAGFPADNVSLPGGVPGSGWIYLGPRSVISADGASLLYVDQFGHRVGSVLGGGSVTIQNALYVVAAPGSLIDVSGTESTLDLATGQLIGIAPQYAPDIVASNGGSISISAIAGLSLDGMLLGRPGDYGNPLGSVATGGSLAIQIIGGAVNSGTGMFPFVNYENGGLIISQQGDPLPFLSPSAKFTPNPAVIPGSGFVSAQTLEAGAFDSVNLQAGQFIQFIGNVTLSGLDNLGLHAPMFTATSTYSSSGSYHSTENPTVTLSAAHILIDGQGGSTLSPESNVVTNHAVLSVDATTLDLDGFSSGGPNLPEIGSINFNAEGDLRFVPGISQSIISGVSLLFGTSDNHVVLSVPVTFRATQIYPLSGVFETIVDTYQPALPTDLASITFARASLSNSGATPLSVGGSLAVFAPVIVQGGVIKVPLGTLTLGSNTGSTELTNGTFPVPIAQSLTLTPDSITSVSLDGNVVPFGVTSASGTNWVVNQPISAEAPPTGLISLNGANIRIQSDPQSGASAVFNGSGGGDLYAYEFTPGVGGTSDVLAQPTASNAQGMYAILPGVDQYSLLGSPANVFQTVNSSSDAVPQYGQMVHLTGVAGLPTGNYVLLPAHYALLPGAYSVTLAANSISAMAQNVVNPVGSYDVLGYLDTATASGVRSNGTHNPWQQFLVQSGSVVRQESQYIESKANSFAYLANAGSADLPIPISPLLPKDAGQLVITPTQSLELDGTGVFNHAPGTIGGRVDLNISRNVAIVGAEGNDGTTGASGTDYGNSAIVITASGINNLHAQSVLIGGSRYIAPEAIQQPNGSAPLPNATYIVALTSNITVDNDAASPLQAPEIILASTDVIDLKGASVIQSVGAVNGPSTGDLDFVFPDFSVVKKNDIIGATFREPTGAPGAVVRVSNGANVNFNRFAVPLAPISGNTGYGNLIIESGAQIASGNAILLEGYQSATLATGALLTAPSITAAGTLVSLGNVPGTRGLTFSGQTFAGLNATQNLTLISTTSIDIWGAAGTMTNIGNANLVNLILDAGQISNRVNGSNVTLTAANVTLQASSTYNSPEGSSIGSLTVNAVTLPNGSGGQLTIGPGVKILDGFSAATLAASKEIISQGLFANAQPDAVAELGSLTVKGSLTFLTPLLTAASNSDQQITATGPFVLQGPTGTATSSTLQSLSAGFFVTAGSVEIESSIVMPSGVFKAEATTGDVVVNPGAVINVSGVAQQFFDQVRYAPGGQINLTSDLGNVTLGQGAVINVSGFMGATGIPAGGDAGTFEVSAGENASNNPAAGSFTSQGQLLGTAASGNQSGSFVLNTGTLADYSSLNAQLNAGGFAESRNLRIRTGNVTITGTAISHTFILSADGADNISNGLYYPSAGSGNITVQGVIDASGTRGGTIELAAGGNVTLAPGSLLDAHATSVAVDGYGKPIDAENEASVEIDTVAGTLDLAGGTINVSVPGADAVTGLPFGGDVHLRAPLIVNGSGDSLQVSSIGAIIGATSVDLEAYKAFTPTGGIVDNALVASIQSAFTGFGGVSPSIAGLANIPASLVHFRPGVEIDYNGDITVEVMNDANPNDLPGTGGWDLSTWRYNNQPGYLTIRAAGNLTINSSLSDGFTGVSTYILSEQLANDNDANGNPIVQTTGPSWSYTLVSGADLRAADVTQVESSSKLLPYLTPSGQTLYKEGNFTLAPDNYIRTGTGNITIAVGGNMMLEDALSTVYTAGVPVYPWAVPAISGGIFSVSMGNTPTYPIANPINFPTDGGNISIDVQGNITAVQTPQLITDWLWRQGGEDPSYPGNGGGTVPATYVPEAWGPIFGLAGPVFAQGQPGISGGFDVVPGYYSFAQGIGALAGGNVTVQAGGNITDLSVVIPSNGYQISKTGTPSGPSDLAIQGGGDLVVKAGGNIGPASGDTSLAGTKGGGPGAIFYVARGTGNISTSRLSSASGSVTAEIAMDDAVVSVNSGSDLKLAPFDPMVENQVFANQNDPGILIPTSNFFLNGFQLSPYAYLALFRSYEFGYTSRSELDETSYAGNILPAFEPFHAGETSNSYFDLKYQFLHSGWDSSVAGNNAIPVEFFSFSLTGEVGAEIIHGATLGSVQVLPPTMRVTAFLGGISGGTLADEKAGYDYLGSDFQFPTSTGTADYLAYKDISIVPALSDADPAEYPTLSDPQAYAEVSSAGSGPFLVSVIATFPESYVTSGSPFFALPSISQAHSQNILHAGDTDPVRIYSVTGSITNTNPPSTGKLHTIFEIPKPVWIKAGGNVTLLLNQDPGTGTASGTASQYLTEWIENTLPSEVSVIEAGLDLDLNVRIDGPGTLYVQAGRDLLGTSQIVSEGNGDDTSLPSEGANITVITGVGGVGSGYGPDYSAFIQTYFNLANTANGVENYLNAVETGEGLGPVAALAYLENLPPELQATYVLPAYYNELKMSGRDYNNPAATDYHNYSRGFKAIDTLFPGSNYQGNLDLSIELPGTFNGPDNPNNIKGLGQGQEFVAQVNTGEINTARGGNIELLAPGGSITVGQPNGTAALNSGITTARGGSISSYSAGSVEVNQSRLATLGGGAIIIWAGDTNPALVPNPPLDKIANIDAGKGSKTELVAPPQSFLVDATTGVIGLDPAAVSTGNGIATLPAVAGAPPSDIDLIAPDGTVNASDAGIRVSGNFNVAAAHVVTNGNISVAGTSVGVPTVAAPNIGGLTAASNTAGSTTNASTQIANQTANQAQQQEVPSLITVEVLGYGGG